MYVIVWEFTTSHERAEAFERAYATDGVWAQFFQPARGYVRTDLFRDVAAPTRFVTHDVWDSEAAYLTFVEENRDRYEELDDQCSGLTVSERRLGAFTVS